MSDTPIKPSADEIANLADSGRDVAGYAVEMYFDPAGERQIGNLIDQLSSRGIRSSRPAASRPHVSLAVFDQVDLERMSVALRKFARECSALRLYLASIGRFPSDEGVVFLAPVVHRELLELHAKLHRMPTVVAGTRREYYLTGRWVPHCTIAEGLTPADHRLQKLTTITETPELTMRNTRTVQPSVFQAPEVVHPIATELERASEWLDQHPVTARYDQPLRCWLHQLRSPWPDVRDHPARRGAQASDGLLLSGVGSSRRSIPPPRSAGARVDPFRVPKKSALQSAISVIDADAWRTINGVLLLDAKQQRIESGTQVRIDSTVTETHILEPSQPPVVRRRARADAAAAAGATAAAAGAPARPPPCGQAAHAGSGFAARCAAASGHLPAAAAGAEADHRLRRGSAASGGMRSCAVGRDVVQRGTLVP